MQAFKDRINEQDVAFPNRSISGYCLSLRCEANPDSVPRSQPLLLLLRISGSIVCVGTIFLFNCSELFPKVDLMNLEFTTLY